MDYKLFDDYITLQALLKETGIIQSGGAIKEFLVQNTVLFNGQEENRRGKKLRLGDQVKLVNSDLTIRLVKPTPDEKKVHQEALAEKARVAEIVKKMNKTTKNKLLKRSHRKNQCVFQECPNYVD
ncbi:S4 domain-containing protein YaaA [Streptococcus hyovaginalis]|uniref:S4 domain-containing protein YaaA n=1 Tax=Streptococcus hyovaginalis TaxID=149015 RepID=UPI003AEBB9A4